jgi:hypothetical protein
VVKGKYGEEEHQTAWRVGGNYNDSSFGYIENDSVNTAPEVYLDAYTGEVVEKHFQDLGAHPTAECNNN